MLPVLGSEATTLTIVRWPVGLKTWSNGRMVSGAPTLILDVEGSVQPLTEHQWQQLGVGGRMADYKRFYTTDEEPLSGDIEGNGTGSQEPDWILWEGRFYRVMQVNEYRKVYPHWKAILQRITESHGLSEP